MSNTKVIYKYQLSRFTSNSFLALPLQAEVLSVALQDENFVLWALVDMHQQVTELRLFSVVGTGWELSSDLYSGGKYIGRIDESPYVWHVFEVTK